MSASQTIDGDILIAWGFQPGRWFNDALKTANTMRAGGADDDAIFAALQAMQPIETLMRTNGLAFSMLIEAENELERTNIGGAAYGCVDARPDHRGRCTDCHRPELELHALLPYYPCVLYGCVQWSICI